ncbi:MAG: NAD(P)H-dependent oxidoreductase [Deltaproteobacteria bacterium]|nr:NAD(P)H-dependent oxidoreductase [Deltaproteobacteria bacterium]MBW1848715.1 NAD(P)H-dependent oxidoreductase [Deltaproteobacteria bacterium]MBW2180609.1 NAD(P)H-dependent oxidoreductase [Deltaproteobacteria bacterium]MBW2364344.1 NAD(P)H-dependent oxidoreductase [Deltaproteobacteria bacterium]
MVKIVGISGSLRKASINTGLLRAAAENAPEGCQVTIGSIKDIPLYNGDIEDTEGIPSSAASLKESIVSADGLLIVTPEYNNSIPGVLKNTVDWISRPPTDRSKVFSNLPVGIMGATPGGAGTAFSQYAWLPVFRILGAQAWSGMLLRIGDTLDKFNENGELIDESTRKQVAEYMDGFVHFIKRIKD